MKKVLIDRYGKISQKQRLVVYGITFKSIKDINLEILKKRYDLRTETEIKKNIPK